MGALFQNSKGRLRIGPACMGAVLCLIATSCGFTQSKLKDEVLAESPRGAVFLQKAQDGWFKTAHPLSLSPVMVSAVLRGVQVMSAPTGEATAGQVFTEEDSEFLSTLISAALSKAAKSQVVGFRVNRRTDVGHETTGGILYVQGRLLHLTFTHYRAQQAQSGRAGPSPRLVPNPTGLDTRQLIFIPERAQRTSRNEQPDVIDTPTLASLVVDYEELATVSGLQPPPTQSHPVRLDQPPGIQRRDQSNAPGLQESPAHSPGTDPTLPFVEDRLRVLKRLHDQGLITEEDYRVKKQQLLDQF